MKWGSIILMTVLLYRSASAQIVNIEAQRMQSDTTGWMGNFGADFLLAKNVEKVLNVNLNAHIQYKTNKSLWLFLTNYNFLKGTNETLSDNFFYHLRYNYKVNAWLRWELFTQLQQNKVTGIDVRVLTGTGPRFKLHGTQKFSLYAATALMYEYEREQTSPPILHKDWRSSSYVSFTIRPTTAIEVISTTFYQPLINKISDYRFMNEINLRFKIAKHVSFSTGWFYLFDNAPAAGAPKVNYSINNGIKYEF